MTAQNHDGDTAILIVAAGRGLRAGGGIPKQYQKLAGKPVLTHAIDRFAAALPGAPIQIVIHPDDIRLFEDARQASLHGDNLLPPVFGGSTRQASVNTGLKVINQIILNIKFVLIHDVVRILLSKTLIQDGLAHAREFGAAVPALAVADSLRRNTADGFSEPVERSGLLAVQTPQCFSFDLICEAHERTVKAGLTDFSDDASLIEWSGIRVKTFPGEAANFKLTTPEDFVTAEALLFASLADIRTGYGYDVHAFCPGDHLWLGGVKTPHSRGLDGHSDADVGLHALTDAILGAIADGDIGMHFPPSDAQWRGAPSRIFLQEAVRRVRALGGMIAHLDLTIVCEEPKVGPHREAIRASIAEIAGLDLNRVAVKATTSEKLGFTGRREGIAANALATVRLPLQSPEV